MEAKQRHEEFFVEGKGRTQRLRQDRFEPARWSCRVVIDGHELEVLNYAAFGIAIVAPAGFSCGAQVTAPFLIHGVEAQRLMLRRVRIEQRPDARVKLAFAVEGEPLSLNRIEALTRAHDLVDGHRRELEDAAGVPAQFRARLYELKHALETLERTVNELPYSAEASFDEKIEFERGIIEVVARRLGEMFGAAYRDVADWLFDDAATVERCRVLFRAELGAMLDRSPIFARSYGKPLGYAGDFEMMRQVYRDEALGPTRFARCLSRYYIDTPNARAVRNRVAYLAGRIQRRLPTADGRPLRILSVACGPAREIQMLLEDPSFDARAVEVHLLDQDATALRATQHALAAIASRRGIAVDVRFVHKAIANVITGGLDDEYDLIYSAGLFDYFSDALARRAAQRLYARLAPGGELVIGNFREERENRAFMELALDWKLIYRSEEELRALYRGIAATLDVDAEPQHINLFVTLRR